MRIELVARAALTLLVLVGVGVAGCSEDTPEKGPVITTAPSATAPPKPSSPQAPDDDFENEEAAFQAHAVAETKRAHRMFSACARPDQCVDRHQAAIAAFAFSTMAPKAAGSCTARSARTLRSTSIPATLSAFTKRE